MTFFGNSVFGGKFGSECFSFFLFCFCLVRGEKVAGAQDFGWQSKGEDHFKSWFPFFAFACDNYVFVQILFGLKSFLYISFVFFRSLIENFLFFFLLLSSSLWSGIFFFCFLPIFDRELSFSFFCFLPRARFMVSWDFGSRLVERLDMIYVRVLVWPVVQG